MKVTDKHYQQHQVFEELNDYFEFYSSISFTIMKFITLGTTSLINIDTYVFSSMQGTIDSIRTLLKNGRINDAYCLLRKYYDSIKINIYSNLYLDDNASLENFIVHQINDWINGKQQLPEYRIMSERCNDHTHYNFYYNLVLNDNEIYLPKRLKVLNEFAADIRNIFILHLSYLFYLNPHYMASSDYSDALDCDIVSEKDSQYWVAHFIQQISDKTIKNYRPDLAKAILDSTCMKLE